MKEIKLFDYQEDMKERIEKALRLHRSVMAQMPTGTGKTVLLASVVESFSREHSNCNVWIVAHRRELVSQIRETIERVFSKITPSLFTLKEGSTSHPAPLSSGAREETAPPRRSEPLRSKVGGPSKVSPDCAGWDRLAERVGDHLAAISAFSVNPASDMMPIKAVSIQWLSKHYDEIEEEPGMIVIDEAHHALAKTYKGMWDRFPKAKFLGLTATPCRLNGKGRFRGNIPIVMFGLLPIEGSWFLRFEKLLKGSFRKSPRPSLPLKRAPPLTPPLSPQERGRKPLLLVARNRYVLRLADHQRSRQIVRDGTALLRGLATTLLQFLPFLSILLLT